MNTITITHNSREYELEGKFDLQEKEYYLNTVALIYNGMKRDITESLLEKNYNLWSDLADEGFQYSIENPIDEATFKGI